MNRPIGRQSITSREEAEALQRAEVLQRQGAAVFGGQFNLQEEMSAMQEVGLINEEEEEEVEKPKAVSKVKPKVKATKQPPVQPEPEEEAEEVEEDKEAFKLSEDPIERLYQISEMFTKTNPNFPSGELMAKWKSIHGNLYVLDAPDNPFIYRYLKRQEWIQMNQNPDFQKFRVDQREDFIFSKCVLYPVLDPVQMASLPAGTVSSIVTQIEQQSMFVDPRELANLTIKL
jgi:hypothetical protein